MHIQSYPEIYDYLEKNDFHTAFSEINNMDLQDLPDLYRILEEKKRSCIHLLFEKDSKEAQDLLDKIIDKAKKEISEISKFQETLPFKKALELRGFNIFTHLVKTRSELLTDREALECLHLIIKEDLRDPCRILMENLRNKKLILEGSPSPFEESINKKCLIIFQIFLGHLHEAVGIKRNILCSLKDKKINILNIIAKQPHGLGFLRAFWNQFLPKLIEKEKNPGNFSKEIISHINESGLDGETPLFTAAKLGDDSLVKKIIEYGGDPEIPSNGIKPIDIKEIKDKVKENLIDAKYGHIHLPDNCPEEHKNRILEKNKNGLIQCCLDGKLDHAKQAITTYGVNPFILDTNQMTTDSLGNSLLMILVNQNITGKQIIDFFEFLNKNKKFIHSIDLTQSNKNGDNLLMLALSKRNSFAEYLVNKLFHKFNIDQENNDGETAAIIAAKNNPAFLKVFLERTDISLDKLIGKKKKNQAIVLIANLIEKVIEKSKAMEEQQKITTDQKEELAKLKTNHKNFKNKIKQKETKILMLEAKLNEPEKLSKSGDIGDLDKEKEKKKKK